ncbi:MAG: hypothetical protein MUF01_11365 [Bryobacterales bacterium]|jgi:hypothetical protein|nr:hypothetical protein [Bryobacterales bacterium]
MRILQDHGADGHVWRNRLFQCTAVLLAVLLAAPPLPLTAQSTNPPTAPTRLKIRALTETPMTEFAGTLSANVLQVRITDEWDMPVRGATVSFRLPESGPGGVFLNGLSSEIAVSDERGEAAVRGFDWRADAGVTFVHVIAALGGARAGAMVEVHLARKLKEFPTTVATPTVATPPEPRQPGSRTQPERAASATPTAPASTRPQPLAETQPVDPPPSGAAPAMASVATGAGGDVRQPEPMRPVGQQSEESAQDTQRAALLPPLNRAPREMEAEDVGALPTMVRVKGKAAKRPNPGLDPAAQALVKVKQRKAGGGMNKALLLVLVAGAAAGGALAVGMGGSGGGSSSGGAVLPPVTRIGSPTITISGGN